MPVNVLHILGSSALPKVAEAAHRLGADPRVGTLMAQIDTSGPCFSTVRWAFFLTAFSVPLLRDLVARPISRAFGHWRPKPGTSIYKVNELLGRIEVVCLFRDLATPFLIGSFPGAGGHFSLDCYLPELAAAVGLGLSVGRRFYLHTMQYIPLEEQGPALAPFPRDI